MSVKDNPFGQTITTEDILDALGFFDDWEDRYKYIIDLGKQLPPMDDALKQEGNLVRGCQSQVWMVCHVQDGSCFFEVEITFKSLSF